jgi:hypothetical protein
MTTVPRVIRKMAFDWLLAEDLPAEWEDAVAQEFDAAIADRKIEFVRTNEQGRPYDTPLVEWEHRELVDIDEVQEIAANQGHRW